jgi:predicted acetyltransferase
MKSNFVFLKPGKLIDGDLELILIKKDEGDPIKGLVPMYRFEMRHTGNLTSMGGIRLRIAPAKQLYFNGNIGYNVNEEYRGHRYAARSCRLIFPFAYENGLKTVWLTVSPKNIPSLKTCKILGAKYIETVRLPKTNTMYLEGDRYMRRFRIKLRNILSK